MWLSSQRDSRLETVRGTVLGMCVLIAAGAFAYCATSFAFSRKGAFEVLDIVRSIAVSRRP
jgi:hypothetical protein